MNSTAARLRLLGAPLLTDSIGTPVGGATDQPYRIALLALLALHPNRIASRETLTTLLWPGLDTKEANQLLNRELFSINKALGDDAIFSNAREVRLGSRVTVDALDFQQALDEGRPGDAMELYTGPLLEDFTLDEAPEFQGWVANQRTLFAAARKALRPLSEVAAGAEAEPAQPARRAAREVAAPPAATAPAEPSDRRKRRKRTPARSRPAEEPPAEAPTSSNPAPDSSTHEEPAAEASSAPAPEEPPPEQAPEPPQPPPPSAPIAAEKLEIERTSLAEAPLVAPPAAQEPARDVFWSKEAPPLVGRAAEQATPDVHASRMSNEGPAEVAPPEPVAPPDLSRFAPPPPTPPPFEQLASESAEPVVWISPDDREPPPYVVPDVSEPVVEYEPPPPVREEKPAQSAPARAARRRRPIRIRIPLPSARVVVTVLLLAALGGGGYYARGLIVDAGAKAKSAAQGVLDARAAARAIAVLPLEFDGRDRAGQLLAAGISDAVSRMLARSELRVTSADAFAFDALPNDPRGIAESLGVAHVLQGRMQIEGDRARFQFQLVSAADGVVRWQQTYAPRLEDILVLQEDVALTVAQELLQRSASAIVRRETGSAAAYRLVLRGNDAARERSDSAAREALALFQQAVAVDSGYARAWAGLASMYVRTVPALPPADRNRQLALASQAAQRAVARDDSLPESHVALGLVRSATFGVAEAETHMRRALELEPGRASREALVDLYLWSGRHDEALAAAERALERDRRSPYAQAGVARVLQFMNRCDDAIARLDQFGGTRVVPRAAETRALCHAQAGRWSDAVVAARAAVTPQDSSRVALLAYMYRRAGNTAESERLGRIVNDRVRRGRGSALDLALLDAGARNFSAAARRVQEAVDARSFVMPPGIELATLMSPVFAELHGQQAFVQARGRLGGQS